MWFWTASALAGAWVRLPGEGYLKIGAGAFQGTEARWCGVSAYGELGVPFGFQLTASAPLGVSTQELGGVVYRRAAAGDLAVGISRRLARTVSATVTARVPLYGPADPERWGSIATRFPAPGEGEVQLDVRVDAGAGWRLGDQTGWVQGGAGWRHRDGEDTDGLLGGVEVGVGGPGFALVRLNGVLDPVPSATSRQGLTVGVGVGVGGPVRVEGWIEDTRIAAPEVRGTGAGLGVSWTW